MKKLWSDFIYNLRGMRTQMFFILLCLGILPIIFLFNLITNEYHSQLISQRTDELQSYGTVIANLVTSSGYLSGQESSEVENETEEVANVYQGKNNEKLDAVGFYATSTDLEYEVFICENFESQESLNNRNHMAASGTIKNQGYYTINLDKEYNISKEKKFAVIVKVSKDKSEKFYKLIPVEMESKEMAVKIDLSDGEGYFSSQGYSWQSAEKQQCNICLKAYTKNK